MSLLSFGPRLPRPCGDGPPGLAQVTARGPGARPRAIRPSPLSEPTDTDPDPGLLLGCHWNGPSYVASQAPPLPFDHLMKEYRPIDQKACDLVSTKLLESNFRPKFGQPQNISLIPLKGILLKGILLSILIE